MAQGEESTLGPGNRVNQESSAEQQLPLMAPSAHPREDSLSVHFAAVDMDTPTNLSRMDAQLFSLPPVQAKEDFNKPLRKRDEGLTYKKTRENVMEEDRTESHEMGLLMVHGNHVSLGLKSKSQRLPKY